MAENYAEIGREGKMEADFNKVRFFKFSEIFKILSWNINYSK